ncbi:MAG: hypothetical protein AAGI37_16905 [Planctomycetota bacterium]
MKRLTSRTRVPFAVSMALICCYSVLMAVVPPSVVGLQQPEQVAVDRPDREASGDVVTRVNTRETERPLR